MTGPKPVLVGVMALLLCGFANASQSSVAARFIGTTPCDPSVREFLGGLSVTAACHSINWTLTLSTNRDSSQSFRLVAVYGLPARSNPNLSETGPKISLQGTWERVESTNGAASIFRIKADESGRSLAFAEISDALLHVLSADQTLMVGTGGWSYSLNRTDRAEKPGDKNRVTDRPAYKISEMATGSTVFGVFEGRSPCRGISRQLRRVEDDGCLKAKWRLTLYHDPQTLAPTTYKVEGTLYWQGAREGTWTKLRGTKPDPNAILYRLEASQSEPPLLFLQGDKNVIFFVDENRNPLIGHDEFSYTLNRAEAK